jgi:hypothetical protein
LKLAISGPSGSGKTYSALLIAIGIGKKIAVVDTENGSASLYAGMEKGPLQGIEFDVLDINPPYTIQRYNEAITTAEKAGYDVLIIDGISPAWAGDGGLLAKKEALDARGGNSYTNWAGITKEHEIFKARLLNADIHLICTLRSKQDYVLEVNEKGKQAPKKVGMAPIQRDGMEYEFTTVFDLAMDHNAIASKDRTSLFDGEIFKPSAETGKKIMAWLSKGAKPIAKPAPAEQPKADPCAEPQVGGLTPEQTKQIAIGQAKLAQTGISETTIWKGTTEHVQKNFGHDFAEIGELNEAEGAALIEYFAAWLKHRLEIQAAAAQKGA